MERHVSCRTPRHNVLYLQVEVNPLMSEWVINARDKVVAPAGIDDRNLRRRIPGCVIHRGTRISQVCKHQIGSVNHFDDAVIYIIVVVDVNDS